MVTNLTVIFIVLMFVQWVVIAVITKSNKNLFDKFNAYSYGLAVKELAKIKPRSALVIRVCYLAALLELCIMLFIKYKGALA